MLVATTVQHQRNDNMADFIMDEIDVHVHVHVAFTLVYLLSFISEKPLSLEREGLPAKFKI